MIDNPNTGIHEAQPFQLFAPADTKKLMQNPYYTPTDWFHNTIQQPDKSNPTRSSNERPLDTVRSFEVAIHREQKDTLDHPYQNRESHYSRNRESKRDSYQSYKSKRYSGVSNLSNLSN